MIKDLVLVLSGALAATTLVIACSDDSPGDADAAACDCDPAEPPLTGRIVRVENRRTQSTPFVFAATSCPDGSTLLGGACYGEGIVSLHLIESGSAEGGPLAWTCEWRNETQVEVEVVAWATCLLPPP